MSRTADRRKRVRFAPIALIAGLAGAATLGLTTTGTLSTFTAQISNTNDAATAATIVMQETDSANNTCTSGGTGNTATCSINKFGSGVLLPGGNNQTTVTIANTGTGTVGSFTLVPTSCTATTASGGIGTADPCAAMTLTITATPAGGAATTIYPAAGATNNTLANFVSLYSTNGLPITGANIPASKGAGTAFKFTVTLPAGSDNTYQGRIASVPLNWNFSAGS